MPSHFWGGLEDIVRPGMRVAVKVNLLKANRPEDCVTTHPAVAIAVARAVKALGADVVIGDSPAGPFTETMLRRIYRISGLEAAAKEAGIPLNEDFGTVDVFAPQSVILKKMTLCKFLYEADVVFNVAKLKTHGMTVYSGAVKNLFGAIPGVVKAEYHFRMPDLTDFTNMLVDINEVIRPRLNVIDAVWGMEGNGPSAGDPRKVGCIIASPSPYAADVVGTTLMHMQPFDVPTVARAAERGLCEGRREALTILGDDMERFVVSDFVVAKRKDVDVAQYFPKFMRKSVSRMVRPKPLIDAKQCIGCKVCVNACPPHAMTFEEETRSVHIDLNTCIRCFCCQELCPQKAIQIKRSRIVKLLR